MRIKLDNVLTAPSTEPNTYDTLQNLGVANFQTHDNVLFYIWQGYKNLIRTKVSARVQEQVWTPPVSSLAPSLPGGDAQLLVTVSRQGTVLPYLEMSIVVVIVGYYNF